jgi:hypothetical protein
VITAAGSAGNPNVMWLGVARYHLQKMSGSGWLTKQNRKRINRTMVDLIGSLRFEKRIRKKQNSYSKRHQRLRLWRTLRENNMTKKNGEESFADAQTAGQFALALQKRLASGDSTTAEARFAELIAQLRGWIVGKTPKSSTPEGSPAPPTQEPHW